MWSVGRVMRANTWAGHGKARIEDCGGAAWAWVREGFGDGGIQVSFCRGGVTVEGEADRWYYQVMGSWLSAKEGGGIEDDRQALACEVRPGKVSWVEMSGQEDRFGGARGGHNSLTQIFELLPCAEYWRVLGVQAEPQSSRAGGDMVQKTGSNGTTIQGVPWEEAEEGGGSGLMVLGRLLGQRPNKLLWGRGKCRAESSGCSQGTG